MDRLGCRNGESFGVQSVKLSSRSTKLSPKSAKTPGIGHTREDLTDRPLEFWNVYSYLVVYDPHTRPLTIIAVLHGARDVEKLLKR